MQAGKEEIKEIQTMTKERRCPSSEEWEEKENRLLCVQSNLFCSQKGLGN